MTEIQDKRSAPKATNETLPEINFLALADKDLASQLVPYRNPNNNIDGERTSYLKSTARAAGNLLSLSDGFADGVAEVGKSAFLFFPGTTGMVGYATVSALDTASASDSGKKQVLDIGLGAAKGALMQGLFSASRTWDIPGGAVTRGVGLGIAARAIDSSLTSGNYMDAKTGEFSLSSGLARTANTAFNPRALSGDIATFVIAGSLIEGLDLAERSCYQWKNSPFWNNVMTAGTFGFSSGASGEAIRQMDAGEKFSFGSILGSGFQHGTLSALSALPGSFRISADVNKVREANLQEYLKSRTEAEASLSRPDTVVQSNRPTLNGRDLNVAEPLRLSYSDARTRVDLNAQGIVTLRSEGTIEYNGQTFAPQKPVEVKVGDKVSLNGKPIEWGTQSDRTVHEPIVTVTTPDETRTLGYNLDLGVPSKNFPENSRRFWIQLNKDSNGIYLTDYTGRSRADVSVKLNGKEVAIPEHLLIKPTDSLVVNGREYKLDVRYQDWDAARYRAHLDSQFNASMMNYGLSRVVYDDFYRTQVQNTAFDAAVGLKH